MGFISDNLQQIKATLPDGVTLVAVSKTKPAEDILEAYNSGHRIFGENKIQEMVAKYEDLPKDIKWHMIGHVQSNKVKYMASFVDLIHGVASLKLLKEINKRAKQNDRTIDILLQVHIAEEESKFGFTAQEIKEIFNSGSYKEYKHIRIKGLMGMATNTDNMTQVADEFQSLKDLFEELKSQNKDISILSMGMSGDYKIAIKKGSNMVRIGSSIFGLRACAL